MPDTRKPRTHSQETLQIAAYRKMVRTKADRDVAEAALRKAQARLAETTRAHEAAKLAHDRLTGAALPLEPKPK